MKATPRPDTDARQRLCHGEDGVRTRLGASARCCVIAGLAIAFPLLVSACVELPGQPPDARPPDAAPVDGSPPPDGRDDGSAPRVIASTPAPDETDVSPAAEISVTFDEDIDPSTVHAASFSVVDDRGRPVLGAIFVEGARVAFVPTIELTLRERYTVIITTEVTDLAGTPLAEEWRSSFSLHDGAFTGIASLDLGNVSEPVLALADRGHGFAVWRRDAGAGATHYTPLGSWPETPVVLTSEGNPRAIDVAASHEDHALAVWRDDAGIRATHYAQPVGWYQGPALLAHGGTEPQAGMDAQGDGVAAWLQRDDTHMGVWARRFQGAGWDETIRVDSDAADAEALQLAMDQAGNGVAVWGQGDDVWSAGFRDGSWEPAALLEQDPGIARQPRLVLDGDGRGMAFWIQHDGTQYRLRWSSLEPQRGWSPPAFADGGPAVGAGSGQWQTTFVFNSHGDAVALWHEHPDDCNPASPVPDPCAVVFVRRFDLDDGWHEVEAVSDEHYESRIVSRVASIDRHGSVWVAWSHVAPESGRGGAWLRRYTPIYGWRPAESLATDDTSFYSELALVSSPQGRMLLAWRQSRTLDELFGLAFY